MKSDPVIAVALYEATQPEFKAYAEHIVKNAHTLAGMKRRDQTRRRWIESSY
jgi:glycine/serine hydroxymethyltransferase